MGWRYCVSAILNSQLSSIYRMHEIANQVHYESYVQARNGKIHLRRNFHVLNIYITSQIYRFSFYSLQVCETLRFCQYLFLVVVSQYSFLKQVNMYIKTFNRHIEYFVCIFTRQMALHSLTHTFDISCALYFGNSSRDVNIGQYMLSAVSSIYPRVYNVAYR